MGWNIPAAIRQKTGLAFAGLRRYKKCPDMNRNPCEQTP